MQKEIHLFILWEKARVLEKKILGDISSNFEIIDTIEIVWEKDKFAKNLTSFYGVNLPRKSNKEQHCGNGPFLLIIVKDSEPLYQWRRTTSGSHMVNVNLFDSKEMYRKWLGGGHRVHASNDTRESNRDLQKLLGYNLQEIDMIYAGGKKITDYNMIL